MLKVRQIEFLSNLVSGSEADFLRFKKSRLKEGEGISQRKYIEGPTDMDNSGGIDYRSWGQVGPQGTKGGKLGQL